MLEESEKRYYDEIFHTGKYFHNVTDCDFIRTACECDKLFQFIQEEGVPIEESLDVKKYMQFAFWLGVIESNHYKAKKI